MRAKQIVGQLAVLALCALLEPRLGCAQHAEAARLRIPAVCVFEARAAVSSARAPWDQAPPRVKQPQVKSNATGLGLILGGIGVAAAGGFVLTNSMEQETIPGSYFGYGIRTQSITYTKMNSAKAGIGGGLVGTGAFLLIKGLRMIR